MQLKFDRVLDLAQLPWFELRDGRLVVADPDVGPVVDVHTHLAMGHLTIRDIDLTAADRPIRHYLPVERPLDLDIYVNQNLTDEDLATVKRNILRGGVDPSDVWSTQTLPNLAQEMGDSAVTHSVAMPIDFFFGRNAHRYLRATAGDDRFVCFGSIHPFRPGLAREVDRQTAMGARGFKLHPGNQLAPLSHPRSIRLFEICGDRGVPVFFHCGPVGIEPGISRRLSQVARYRPAVESCPQTTFVLGHSGALQMERALALALEFDNVWLDLSCQRIANVEHILQHGPTDRILQGSDWPFYHQAIGIAKVLMVTEDRPELRRKVLYDNAARLYDLGR